jgi:segregation and condensation protein B
MKQLSLNEIKKIIHICLVTATESISCQQIKLAFESNIEIGLIEKIIFQLANEYQEQGIELLHLNNGYRLRSKIEYQKYLDKIYKNKTPRYSKSIMETLAIITYKQPITRSEIEQIRGVSINNNILNTLFEIGWIEVAGTKELPGRPELLATTNKFLDDFGISSIHELPQINQTNKNINEELELIN